MKGTQLPEYIPLLLDNLSIIHAQSNWSLNKHRRNIIVGTLMDTKYCLRTLGKKTL
jgi:hypothetical protein